MSIGTVMPPSMAGGAASGLTFSWAEAMPVPSISKPPVTSADWIPRFAQVCIATPFSFVPCGGMWRVTGRGASVAGHPDRGGGCARHLDQQRSAEEERAGRLPGTALEAVQD